jgi:CBS domain-containing protein
MMQLRQVRRLPVIDYEGRLVGIVSLNDIARRIHSNAVRADGPTYKDVATTLAAVSEPHRTRRSPSARP